LRVSAFPTDETFPHRWQAEVLEARPLILPSRHFTYPREVEEVERGALELLIKPGAAGLDSETGESRNPRSSQASTQPFLATCALGFRDPAVPTGIWSAPNPDQICAVSGGYAYIIDTTAPERFTMIPYRPVMEVRALPDAGLLLFVGNRTILAWAAKGQQWESERLSNEGLTISAVENEVLRGMGWRMMADKDIPFAIDLRTGRSIPAIGA
jgi:hypothetical protein